MIIEAPLNTRDGAFDPAAPGPATSKHWAISEKALGQFNQRSMAKQLFDNAMTDADTYRDYHLGLVEEGPDAEAEKRFVMRNYEKQVKDVKALYEANLANIEAAAFLASERYSFFTDESAVAHCADAWAFDAPNGFGDLPYEDAVNIALAARPS